MVTDMPTCKMCGSPLGGYRNMKYCPSCAKEVHRVQARKCSHRYRERAKGEAPLGWIAELSTAEKALPIGMQQLYGERFVQIANEKIRQIEQLV